MKRRITLSIALALSVVLLSLVSSDSTVNAQRQPRFTADTGLVALGPNQILRIAVDPTDPSGNTVFFRRIGYTPPLCNDEGVCKHTISSQTNSGPVSLMPGEALSVDIPSNGSGVRGIVTSNRPVVVNAQIIDVETGNINGIIAILIGL